jgi:hypothetical protein
MFVLMPFLNFSFSRGHPDKLQTTVGYNGEELASLSIMSVICFPCSFSP